MGTTLLLWLGPTSAFADANWIDQLHSAIGLASFSGGFGLVSALVGWAYLGRNASDYVVEKHPSLTTLTFYLAPLGGVVAVVMALYYAMMLLNRLSNTLGCLVIVLALIYRMSASTFWVSVTGSSSINRWITLTVLATLIVGGPGAAWVLDMRPSMTQWAILSLYALAIWMAAVAPLDTVCSVLDDELQVVGVMNEVRRLLADQKSDIEERAPSTVDLDVEIPSPASTPEEATAMTEPLETKEQWLDAYEAYVDARLALANHLPRDVRQQAMAADGTLETRVAILAENLRPSHYDEATEGADAADTFARLVKRYTHDHLPDNFMAGSDLLQVAGPSEDERTAIEDALDPLPA